MAVDWKRAPSGTGEDGYFDLGVFQVRRQFRASDRAQVYKIHFLPYAQFQSVFEDAADEQERRRYLDQEWERFAQTKCVANGIAIGMLERVRPKGHVSDPIVTAIEALLRERAPQKLMKAEILSLTGLTEGQWTHFLSRRPSSIELESHGRGARYWFTNSPRVEPSQGPRPGTSPDDAGQREPARPPVPKARFADFVGQPQLKERLETFIRAARERGESLDHVLLAGPPGLGKSTLAEIIAGELGRPLHSLMAPSLTISGLQEAMETVRDGEIVFLDEIHRLNQQQQEQLFAYMKRRITVIAATNFPASLLPSLRDRFSIVEDLRLYTEDELVSIVNRATREAPISATVALKIARRSRGTPRTALNLLRRLRDLNGLTDDSVEAAFSTLEVDALGLTSRDRELLAVLSKASAPVGIETLASTLNESTTNVEQMIEPFLLQQGFIERTKSGRIITDKGRAHLAGAPKARKARTRRQSEQEDLPL